jgi:Winged helix DNA-binding domain
VDICAQRLVNQHLVTQKLVKGSDVVRLLGAVQAQDYLGAQWALSQRTRGATAAEIETEIDEGGILRTHVLRPTWHFVAPEDIRWMLALTAPRVKGILAHYDRVLEIDKAELRRSHRVLAKALAGGTHLTRTELAAALARARIRVDDGQRLARLVMHAELDGLICNGPRRGKQFTYALLDERVPPARAVRRDEALHDLAARYFTTRGPATTHDFAWWSGLGMTDARSAIHAAESSLQHEVIGERSYWFPPPRAGRLKSPLVRLLSNYDEYFIGHKDRGSIHSRLRASGIAKIPGALSGHVVTIDGQVVGLWERALSASSGVVVLKPLVSITGAGKAIAREVDRFADFLGVPVHLRTVRS